METLDETKLKRELMIDARALDIPIGAAEIFIDRAIKAGVKKLRRKSIITETDIKIAISAELSKYHKDFAYVYKNRDKII